MLNTTLTQHFGMTKDPFDRSIDAAELFEFAAFKELEARLHYLIDRQGMGLVTGEVGAGKTSAVRRVLNSLHPGTHKPIYLVPSSLSIRDIYCSIAVALGLSPLSNRVKLVAQIRAEIERLVYAKKLRPVVAIDEVQLLRTEILDEIRILTNFDMDSTNLMTILLIGQTEFRRKMAFSAHEAFSQRLLVRYHLDGIKRSEVSDYIAHQLNRAGVHVPLFTDAAVDALYQASKGTLRPLNLLCSHALLAASLERKPQATVDHVHIAVCETN